MKLGKYILLLLKEIYIISVLGKEAWAIVGNYLGLPTEWGRSRNIILQWIREKRKL